MTILKKILNYFVVKYYGKDTLILLHLQNWKLIYSPESFVRPISSVVIFTWCLLKVKHLLRGNNFITLKPKKKHNLAGLFKKIDGIVEIFVDVSEFRTVCGKQDDKIAYIVIILLVIDYCILINILHCMKNVHMRSYSGPHFPAFGLKTERYSVSFHSVLVEKILKYFPLS